MKTNLIVILGVLSLTQSVFAKTGTTVLCSAKIDNKTESMKIRINNRGIKNYGPIVFWSDTEIVSTQKKSYFSNLSSIEDFGLEGHKTFFTKDGYSVLKVMNTAESIEIAVHRSLNKGVYIYHDDGSGLGDTKIELTCKVIGS